ncbi:MAG TPA: paraquat-inducible protein A [Bryobacteraceae bacterium]|nr:paraquat-inducible protein A [Bryobacteraceae bacterium]
MLSSERPAPSRPEPRWSVDFRLAAAVLLLVPSIVFTWLTIDGLAARRKLRVELAEISHARYDLLNADRWVEKIVPILDARIDALDLSGPSQASLRPTVENALYRLLDDVKEKMAAKDSGNAGTGKALGQGNLLIVNMMVGALRPHVPEYADVVLAELGKPETKQALKNYLRNVLAQGAKNTFGNVDMRWYSSILKQHGCASAGACQQELDKQIRQADVRLTCDYLSVLVSSALAFVLLMIGRRALGRSGTVVLLLFCMVLLAGGILSPMIEVEAKISRLSMTFLGEPIAFSDQVLYFQSKTVLEVFQTLIHMGRPDMWIVGVLVLMFSVVFPTVKMFTLALCLHEPARLRTNQAARFFALESSKWSMADVMALAIFMSFVAFNGLIANTMGRLMGTGATLVLPTDSSKILPGYPLFIGYCLAGLFLSKKLEHGIEVNQSPGNAA